MKTENRQFDRNRGSALILVVVVTVLLAVIGTMFLMVSRAGEAESGSVTQSRELDAAVETVVTRISQVLTDDLFGSDDVLVNADTSNPDEDELWDAPWHGNTTGRIDDTWLSTLEPLFVYHSGAPMSYVSYKCVWPHITDLWNRFDVPVSPTTDATELVLFDPADPVRYSWMPENPSQIPSYPSQADADGDGVADSRWVRIPDMTTSRGEPLFAAVRIIDNCAMLNLNAAYCFYQEPYNQAVLRYKDGFGNPASLFKKPWFANAAGYGSNNIYHNNQNGSGRYLTEINYLTFLRGSDLADFFGAGSGDQWYNLMKAKGFWNTAGNVPLDPVDCQERLMTIETEGSRFFDIGDELELRNRFILTSKAESPVEQRAVLHYSLNAGGGPYAALDIPRENKMEDSDGISLPHVDRWYWRLFAPNFDHWDSVGNFLQNNVQAQPDYHKYIYCYDRRHLCTVYSFDRSLRKGDYPLLEQEIASGIVGPDMVRSLLIPKGAVTTNIQDSAGFYNNSETRKRILQLLYALREYFYEQNGHDLNAAAVSAAQVLANIIDFSDNTGANGPFASATYNSQLDENCTFITESIIENMVLELSSAAYGLGNQFTMIFGLNPGDVIFGYERQPFISEIYVQWDGLAPANSKLKGFAIELINPYDQPIDVNGWKIRFGATEHTFTDATGEITEIRAYDPAANRPGHLVIRSSSSVVYDSTNSDKYELPALTVMENYYTNNQNLEIRLLRPLPISVSGKNFISIDSVASAELRPLFVDNYNFLKRDDRNWKFVYQQYGAPVNTTDITLITLGQPNNMIVGVPGVHQFRVNNDGLPLERWHDLETLAVLGNGPANDPNVSAITYKMSDPNSVRGFDLTDKSGVVALPDYLCTLNRPEIGSLPGRININTAPMHVIAAAIPPNMADPNAAYVNDPNKAVTFSALQLANAIVTERQNGPYVDLADLLDRVPRMNRYGTGGDLESANVGSPSIQNDIEENHWILSNLANKFTVRSDTFTAYILVRAGLGGPERRMIAIFDRSQVWTRGDRPRLVALHPVPDVH